MEEIGATNPEYQPLQVLWHRSCAHARKTIPPGTHSIVYQTNSTFIVLGIVGPKILQIPSYLFAQHPCKLLPSIKIIIMRGYVPVVFFFLCFIFIAHFSVGLRDPRKLLFEILIQQLHTLICLITPSFLHGFQPNLYQYFSYVCSTTQTTFSIANSSIYFYTAC